MVASRVLHALPPLLLLAATAPPQDAPRRSPTITLDEATFDDRLEVAGDAILGETVETRMAVDVAINGRGPYRFVVDSGADRSAIGERLAASLRLPPGRAVTLHGMAGSSRRETALIDTLTVGGTTVADVAAPVLPERYLGASGLLGIDALRGQRLMLDFENQAITIEDARRAPAAAAPGDIIVTARRRGGQLILTQARAGGVAIRAVVDTGSQLTIGNLALRDALFRRRNPPAVLTSVLTSVTGDALTVSLAVVPELRIGDIRFRDVAIAFADLPPFALFGLSDSPAMMLGTDVLGGFRRVSLDFRARKVRFQLRRCTEMRTGFGGMHLRMTDDGADKTARCRSR